MLGSHAGVRRIDVLAFGEVEASLGQDRVDRKVTGFVPLADFAAAATRVVHHCWVHNRMCDAAQDLGQRHVSDGLGVVLQSRTVSGHALDVGVFDHLQAQGQSTEERIAHDEVRTGFDHFLRGGHVSHSFELGFETGLFVDVSTSDVAASDVVRLDNVH